jgi:cellulose synthase/poly-beta-1,6-N-acetylglucosamine synthase-like glycosyltransferase
VSVLLPTYNESNIISRKLEELVSLDYPMENVEIVVVDSSDDGTADSVRQFFEDRSEPELRLVTQAERRGVAAALNEGVETATGDVVFRTDADSSLENSALTTAVETLSNPAVGGVTGRQVEVLGESAVESNYRDLLTYVQLVESHVDSTYICHGPCFAFERDLYEPIPEDTIADDTETGIRIREQGFRIVMDPDIGFIESGVSAFGERRQRKDRRAAGLLQTLFRHRGTVGKLGRYGRFVLPLNWLLLVTTPWSLLLAMGCLSLAAIAKVGVAGLVIPGLVLLLFWLGSNEFLGPAQPAYAVFDSQVSLIAAAVSLVRGSSTAIWEIDEDSRDAFRE